MQIRGQPLPAAAFCRSPEGDGNTQSPTCWVKQEATQPLKGGITLLDGTEGSDQTQAPSHTRELVAALRNASPKTWGVLFPKNIPLYLLLGHQCHH